MPKLPMAEIAGLFADMAAGLDRYERHLAEAEARGEVTPEKAAELRAMLAEERGEQGHLHLMLKGPMQ